MNSFLTFFSFQDPNVRMVAIGMVFISIGASLVGSFAFLRKKSLVGDAVAHSLLPGIAVAFMISGSKNPWILIFGALMSGWISILLMDYITKKTKLKADTSIAMVLSVMFGLGIMLLTHIQHSGAGNQSGLDKFLFGKAASLSENDLYAFGTVTGIIIILVFAFYKELKLLSFNEDYGKAIGLPIKSLNFLLNTLLVLAIIAGIQAVGVVLMAALLIAPAAAAKSWTYSLDRMIWIAAFIAILSSFMGSYISYTYPNMPTGPWIVVVLSVITLFSLFFAPKRGVVARHRMQKQNYRKIRTENLLKTLYHLGENKKKFGLWHLPDEINKKRNYNSNELQSARNWLSKQRLVLTDGNKIKLTKRGFEEAKRVVRLHRLWEMYLTQRMNLQSDHIHPNAETIEHIITPELEKDLIKELNQPIYDPHHSKIPYVD